MPRIPDEVITQAKELDLAALVRRSGVELSRASASELVGLCALHKEKTPSLFVNPERHSWYCHGCGKGGSTVDWVMETEKLPFRKAVEWLVREYLPDAQLLAAPAKLPKEEIEQLLAASDHELQEWVLAFYRETLSSEAKPQSYLERRGLGDPDLYRRFGIGFSDRELGLRLPAKAVKAGGAIRKRLQDLGFFKTNGHEHMRGRVVVPIRDLSGRLVQLYGRTITPNLRKGTPHHLYLPSSIDGVFHPEAVIEHQELILCEAIFDALTFVRHGFENATTSFGVNNFSPALFAAMQAHGTRRVLIAYDRDDVGETAAKKLAEKLIVAGIDPYRVRLPRGLDVNAYACKVQPAAKSLDLVLRQATWMGDGTPPRWPVEPMAGTPAPEAPAILDRDEPSARAAEEEKEAASEPASQAVESAEATTPAETDSDPDPAPDPEASSSSAASPAAEPAQEPDAVAADSGPQPSGLDPAPSSAEPSQRSPTLLPAPPPTAIPAIVREHEVLMQIGDRHYRIRGLAKNLSYDVLKISLRAVRERGEAPYLDSLDLCSSRQRRAYVKQAALEIGIEEKVVKRDIAKVVVKLEELQEEQIQKALEPKVVTVTLTEAEQKEARELLCDPTLIHRILVDLEACGVVGEETNKLVLYLASVSRLLRKPLAVMVQSSSAAGKSALMDSVLSMVPEEQRVVYSAMTGQSLFYMGESNLKNKVLAIAEEEGAEQASYALKLLQSEGKLSIASTGKDPATGRLMTHEYHVEGPAAILTTTTSIDLDEELLNRCLVLGVDESREQTRAIHEYQREGETLDGLLQRRRRDRIRALHQNAQRLLRSFGIVNLYARQLTFPESCTRTRRDHEKYLTLIRAITLLRQAQREVKTGTDEDGHPVEYIEATLEDIALANELAHEVLGRTLDELPPQTRRLVSLIYKMVKEACERLEMEQSDFRFFRRELREHTGWGDTQLKVHLGRLVDLEYLVVHRHGHAQRHVYELLYDGGGQDGGPFLPGLIDVEALATHGYDGNRSGFEKNRSGQNGDRSAPGRPAVGGWSGGGRVGKKPAKPAGTGLSGETPEKSPESTVTGSSKNDTSRHSPIRHTPESEASAEASSGDTRPAAEGAPTGSGNASGEETD